MWLRQSTIQVIPFGPFLDKGNGVDLEIGLLAALDHAATGIMLSKNGGTLTIREQGANFVASAYDAHGCYKVSLSAIDTGTLGRLRVIYTDPATNLPVWQDCMVVPAQVWDSLFGADKLDVAVVEQANLGFGALQIAALNAATPAGLQGTTQTLDALATLLRGADSDTLKTLSDQIDLQALETTLNAMKGADWTTETLKAIKAAIPTQGATTGELGEAVAALAIEANIQGHAAAALTAYDPPTRAEATADKGEVLAAIGYLSTQGTGAITWTYTLTRSDNGLPIADAEVWITTDVTGHNVIASGRTDQNGLATFYLDAGTVYVWRQKAGFNFTNPDTEVVS